MLFLHQILLAQNSTTIKGRVFDRTTKVPLSFASVYVPNSGTGVITNEFGEFNYHIPENFEREVLVVSYIGYKKIYLKVASLKPGIVYNFDLIPDIKNIKEVEITGIKGTPASFIVKRAINKIRKNYPQENFLLQGYYRDYIKDRNLNDYKNLTEAAVVIEDKGFRTKDYQRSKIKLEQIRYNPGFIADSALNSGYNNIAKYVPYTNYKESNELAILRLHDPIRNHNRKTFSYVNTFDESFILNHTFRYESILYNDSSKIFEISFKTYRIFNSVVQKEYWVNGKIYIQSGSYAILKFTYTVTCKFPSYEGKFFDLKLEYKNYMNKYYLNYLSLSNYFEFQPDTSAVVASNPKQYFQYRELFVNKIVTKSFEPIKKEESIRKDTCLLSNKIPILEGFWNSYNFTSTLKLIE